MLLGNFIYEWRACAVIRARMPLEGTRFHLFYPPSLFFCLAHLRNETLGMAKPYQRVAVVASKSRTSDATYCQ